MTRLDPVASCQNHVL